MKYAFLFPNNTLLFSVLCVIAEGLGWRGERGEGGQPGQLEGLLVFLRDRGKGLQLWHTFVIDSPQYQEMSTVSAP